MGFPGKIDLAHLPTPIRRLDRLSSRLGRDIFMKRDDMTGIGVSGNKVRKLEFVAAEALDAGAGVLVTCGGLQSNHARATAVTARRLGLGCHLVLRGIPGAHEGGNHFLNRLLGAEITTVEPELFNTDHPRIMEDIGAGYASRGVKPWIIPMGASNPTGTLGYAAAYEEILRQEETLDGPFQTIVCAVGSGGTHAGLVLGNLLHRRRHRIVGVPVCDDARYFRPLVEGLVSECLERLDSRVSLSEDDLEFIDGYAGRGYALNTREELDFIVAMASGEGILLDPVYTGKAFRGLVTESRGGALESAGRTLFIHTGGLYGLFSKAGEFGL